MKFQQMLTLARVPNIPTVWSNVLMAWKLAGGPWNWQLPVAMLGGTLLYAGGCTHNDACDAAWDARHKSDRLIPSGTLTLSAVMSLALWEMRIGVLIFILLQPATFYLPLLLAGAILLYNFRHKENPFSVVIMGACRALLILTAAGASTKSGGFLENWYHAHVLTAAAVVWLYIITLSLLARRESRPGGSVLRALRPAWSVGRWVGEMLAAIPLVDAALLLIFMGSSGWKPALICVALWPLCRLLQRKYAAT